MRDRAAPPDVRDDGRDDIAGRGLRDLAGIKDHVDLVDELDRLAAEMRREKGASLPTRYIYLTD